MDELYAKKLLELLEADGNRNKTLSLLDKDGFRVDGWSKLNRLPDGRLAKLITGTSKAEEKFLSHICEIYFGKMDSEKYHDIIDGPLDNPKLLCGYLAAFALFEEEDTEKAVKLFDGGIETASAVATPSDYSNSGSKQQVNNGGITNLGETGMRLLGYIRVVKNFDRDYYNFHPIMEINDKGELVPIDDAFERFPNRGNIFIYTKYQDKIISDNFLDEYHYIFNLEEADLEENFKKGSTERNETNYKVSAETLVYRKKAMPIEKANIYYVVTLKDSNIDFSSDIVIDDVNYYIGDKVLLNIGNKLYGPFELYEVEGTNKLCVKPEKNNYIINTYECKQGSVNSHLIDLKSGYRGEDRGEIVKKAVYINDEFNVEELDYIPDAELLDKLNNYLASSKYSGNDNTLQKIYELKENLNKPNSSIAVKGKDKFTEGRYKRIITLLSEDKVHQDNVNKLVECIENVLKREQSSGNPHFELIIKKLIEDKEFLGEIVPKFKIAQDEVLQLQNQIIELKEQKENLRKEGLEQILKQQADLKKSIEVLTEQEKAAKEKVDKIKNKLELVDEIDYLTYKVSDLRKEKIKLDSELDSKINQIQSKIGDMFDKSKMAESIAESIKSDYVSDAIIDASARVAVDKSNQEIFRKCKAIADIGEENINKLTGNDLINDISNKIQKYRSNYSHNDVVNILICYTQGFITVFSGDPGTGKTSICNILAHALGSDKISSVNKNDGFDRYIPVSVERGWTSKRDLIGYYNPLTKSFDSNNGHLYEALRILDSEAKNKSSKYPLTVLLDEANLSPMEYYWADFMNLCDDWNEANSISLGNNEVLRIPETLRFLATINNDHTTEILSPRLIDRAWIIILPTFTGDSIDELELSDTNELVTWESLKDALSFSDDLSGRIKIILEKIYKKCKEKNISVSPRTRKAIENYCKVAQNLFNDTDQQRKDIIAVDYAISQKLLTKLSGSGEDYKEFIEGLLDICKSESLVHSCEILNRMIQRGNSLMGYYKFF